jgi:hypothetical protein
MSRASHLPAAQVSGGWRAALGAAALAAALGAGCASRVPAPAPAPAAPTGVPAAASPALTAPSPSGATLPAPSGALATPAPVGVNAAPGPSLAPAARPPGGATVTLSPPLPPPVAPLIAPGDPAPTAQGSAGGPPFDAGGALTLEAGLYRCELDRRVTVRRIAADGRSLVLNWRGRDSVMHAVQARTGALRFENPDTGHVWLVIVGKSILLDARAGRTLANECRL